MNYQFIKSKFLSAIQETIVLKEVLCFLSVPSVEFIVRVLQ